MSRHAHRHRGRPRPLGSWRHGRHAAGRTPPPAPARTLAELVGSRPRGPYPYDIWPDTQPLAAHLAIEPVIERSVA